MYIQAAEFSVESLQFSRRMFLQSGSVLLMCLAGCRSFTANTRFASAMISDPQPDEYRPVLKAIINTILPFDHPRFPAFTEAAVESTLYSYFPINDDDRFLTLQKSLIFFNETSLFPHSFAPIINEEKNDSPESPVAEKENHDKQLYRDCFAELNHDIQLFTDLSSEQQKKYLQMWGQSGFRIKRQLYRSVKSLVMIAAYSSNELWKTIGYDGPLLTRG